MKKIVFILITTLCINSCTKPSFKITGSVDNQTLNGKTIFIKERINREWKSIDSTKIENQKFSFKGKNDTSRIVYLVYSNQENKRVRQAFVLENAEISVSVDSSNYMTFKGTPDNELLQQYQDQKNAFNKKSEGFYSTFKNSNKTPCLRAAFDKKQDELNAEEVSIDKNFAIKHVNTLVGTHVFVNSFYEYNLAEKQTVVNLMNPETKKNTRIQEIIADMEVETKVAVGKQFIDIELAMYNGKTLSLSELVGKTDYVLIDFWASWCGPCMEFLPELQAFYSKYKGTKLEIYGVSLDDSKDAWAAAIKSHKIEWKLVSDLKGWKCKGSRTYAVNSIPSTVLIDKTGKIVGKNLSIIQMEEIINKKVDKK